ncbi:MAG: ribonuclease HII [Clostridia bacterium]|nr:ribonuclease HII [Clostridia bacterium]
MPTFDIENALKSQGYKLVCGVDEAGRGPLAGPVCAAAVILPDNCVIEGLDDSKKLTEKKREALFDVVKEKAIAYSVVLIDNHVIDEINILNATLEAMTKAVEGLKVTPDFVIIDGNKTPSQLKIPCDYIIKGDALSMSIAAASILAKVTRDRLMLELDKQYPCYQFAKHKGYGTKLHTDLIKQHGPCEIHRASFLKKILN